MPNLRRTYSQGRINLDIENRLLSDGEYREAFNALIFNNESNKEGSVKKSYSNKKLTNLDLGNNAKCVLGISHPSRNRVYWGVVSDSGSYLLEYDFTNEIATFVLKDTRAIGSRVFDLNENFLCTGIEIITHDDIKKELLLMTDDNMQPLCFNIERAKTWGENEFEKEDIFLIKKPPRYAPVVTPVYTNDRSNNLEDKFLTFSYRYKYRDGEYSALSSFTNYNFNPKKFELDYFTLINKGMINRFNAVKIDFNTGDKRVTEIQLVVKESNSNTPYLIETYNKKNEGFGDNEIKSFVFSNQKLYSALSERELYRVFDNVPLKAKALTVIGNRAIFGNYLEFFDIKDENGNDIVIDYDVSLVSESIEQGEDLTINFPETNEFTFETPISITSYRKGFTLFFYLNITISGTNIYTNEFSYIIPEDYLTIEDLVSSPDFTAFVGVMNNHFIANYNSEGQYEIDPDYALNTETSLSFALVGGVPTFTVNPIIFEDTANANAIVNVDLAFNSSTNIGLTSLLNTASCKSNKNYEVGLIYLDEFNRATTTLTSKNNTLFIPQQYSIFKNKLRVTLNNIPPFWADRYKLVVKTNPLQYQTIYVNEFYNQDNYVWAKLQSDNKDKVKVGDNLILKVGGDVIANQPIRIKVLEIKEFDKDFIDNNQDQEGNDIIETSGVYMKIRPEGFSMDLDDYTIKQSESSPRGSSSFPIWYLDLFTETTPSLTELDVPQGSSINIFIKSNRKYNSGWENVTYENTFFTQRDYATLEEWFNEIFLNGSFIPGVVDTSGETENYAPNLELVRGNISISFGFQVLTPDPSGKLYLKIKGLRSGGSNDRKGYGSAKIVIRKSTGIYVFETEPKQADNEIFYETEQTFNIVSGEHQGNIQNQDNATLSPAIIDLDFFNCFAQGNGVESYRVRDEFNSRFLNIDLRPSTTSIEPYKQVRRFADLTYSEPFVESSGINGLNVFNLSTANFKEDLDKQFGSIQKLHSRENDIVVLQEDKAGKVLFNKQAIYTADGNAALTATPNVLGQYIPYAGNRGIGKNPESFSTDDFGRIKYASVKTGNIIRLSIDGIEDIVYGLRNFFGDIFSNRTKGKIISGYDPHLDLTTFTIEENITEIPIYNCGNEIVKINLVEPFIYQLQLNELTGDIVLNYNITEGSATIEVVYDETTNVVSGVSGIGNITIERNDLGVDLVTVTITPVSESINFTMTNNCPLGVPLDIVLVVINDESDNEKTIINRFRSDLNAFIQNEDLFTEGPITRFQTLSGLEGVSLFPTEGSLITIQSVKGNSNTGSFLPIDECNRIGYLISDTEYTEATLNNLLDEANYLTLTETIQGLNQNTFTGNFVFSRPLGDEKLYLIWDYTNRKPNLVNDSIVVENGSETDINVLSNDSNLLIPIVVSIITPPINGTASVNLDNTIKYIHNGSVAISDTIVYRVSNGNCYSEATINISVNENFNGCYKLLTATYYNEPIYALPSYDFNYLACNSELYENIVLSENITENINTCIDPQSIILESITPLPSNEEIEDAILNNEGIINITLTEGENIYGRIEFVFNYC